MTKYVILNARDLKMDEEHSEYIINSPTCERRHKLKIYPQIRAEEYENHSQAYLNMDRWLWSWLLLSFEWGTRETGCVAQPGIVHKSA
jgi:hypothetical protein